MLLFDGALGLVMLGLWIFCLIDVITTDSSQMRHLPKAAWLLIVLLLPDIGSIVWLVIGHDWSARRVVAPTPLQREFPQYDRPGRHIAVNPDDDEAFLRQVRARAEEQRRRADEQRKQTPES
jgi:hypothetical protein